MGLFNGLFDAVLKRRGRSRRKQFAQPRQSLFRLEPLEPRLLLSSDVLPVAPLQDQTDLTTAAIVEQQPPSNQITVSLDGWGEGSTDSGTNDNADTSSSQPLPLGTQSSTLDTQSSTVHTVDPLLEDCLATTSFDDPGNIVAQLTEILHVANAPPMLSELRLVNDDLSLLSGQIFYLDFDGASGLTYAGPVRVENVKVYPFRAPTDLAGQDATIISLVLSSLNERFASLGVTFTTIVPTLLSLEGEDRGEGVQYSTIFIGGDDSAFSRYGSFFGLAEQVDIGNRDRSDNAFVFSDKIFQPNMSAEDYASVLTEVIVHEALHLLGYTHANGETAGLSGVAAQAPPLPDGATITVNSTADTNFPDKELTLREAILLSNRIAHKSRR